MKSLGLDDRVIDIIVCPYCKCGPLDCSPNEVVCSTCLARFPIDQENKSVDFRIIPPGGNALFEKYWQHGQDDYERWARELPTDAGYDEQQIRDSRHIYESFWDISSITGVLLDIGGRDGRLRHFTPPQSKCAYVAIDPYKSVRQELIGAGKIKAYPELKLPCDFVCGTAEHLPFAENSINHVRINSVLDHLWDAHLGMREIVRVLKPGGLAFLGVYVTGKKTKWQVRYQAVKDLLKKILGREEDHHVWHPSLDELNVLVDTVGLCKVRELVSEKDGIIFLLEKPI